jgi:hypothetical protein
MVSIDSYISQAQIGFAMMVIAFVFVWRFFVKYQVPIEYSEKHPTKP